MLEFQPTKNPQPLFHYIQKTAIFRKKIFKSTNFTLMAILRREMATLSRSPLSPFKAVILSPIRHWRTRIEMPACLFVGKTFFSYERGSAPVKFWQKICEPGTAKAPKLKDTKEAERKWERETFAYKQIERDKRCERKAGMEYAMIVNRQKEQNKNINNRET